MASELSFGDGRVIIMANAKVCECILFTCRTAALSSSPSLLPMLALPVVRQKAVSVIPRQYFSEPCFPPQGKSSG